MTQAFSPTTLGIILMVIAGAVAYLRWPIWIAFIGAVPATFNAVFAVNLANSSLGLAPANVPTIIVLLISQSLWCVFGLVIGWALRRVLRLAGFA